MGVSSMHVCLYVCVCPSLYVCVLCVCVCVCVCVSSDTFVWQQESTHTQAKMIDHKQCTYNRQLSIMHAIHCHAHHTCPFWAAALANNKHAPWTATPSWAIAVDVPPFAWQQRSAAASQQPLAAAWQHPWWWVLSLLCLQTHASLARGPFWLLLVHLQLLGRKCSAREVAFRGRWCSAGPAIDRAGGEFWMNNKKSWRPRILMLVCMCICVCL